MPKSVSLTLLFALSFPFLAFAKTDSIPSKYFSLGPRKAGICFGDAPVYSGFKFGLLNDDVRKMNGFDVSLLNVDRDYEGITNGISIGAGLNSISRNNGIAIAGIWNTVSRENGIMLSPINLVQKMNGYVAGAVLVADTLNGLVTSYTLQSRQKEGDSLRNRVNGMAICIIFTNVNEVRGVAISAYNSSYQHKGLAVGGFNKTNRLKGVQLGLYNIAMNNPKGLRRLPLINAHFGK
ncbi:hypothetical protein [Chitinophaga sp. S165]|uniref:hypothetical protein n=1 Tax=Chitinophaga sp. S165 TaxID=2135462 RepID=UPI000D71B263|nr:hypothetical protein [Chitinophaga sp. S165]PWV49066.1 hypothetical protein C7475_106312 [Chitinophaga sp. S165]